MKALAVAGLLFLLPWPASAQVLPPVDVATSPAPAVIPERTSAMLEEALDACMRAIHLGQVERLQRLWQQQPPDPNAYHPNGRTLLDEAVATDRPDIVKWLLERGADPNRNVAGISPLHRAAQKAGPETVAILLSAGAIVDATNPAGETPLYLAMRPGCGAVVEKLLQAGANPDHLTASGRTPLHQAAEWADGRVVGLLLNATATIDLPDRDSSATPLHLAVIAGNLDAVKALVRERRGLNARDRQGSAPLHFAMGDPEIVRVLIEAGADINQPGDGERTPLHEAIQAGHLETVKLLLERRADRGARSRRGETPLELARRLERREMIELLEGR